MLEQVELYVKNCISCGETELAANLFYGIECLRCCWCCICIVT